MATVTVWIPDSAYDFLERKARREETSVEQFLLRHVDRLVMEGRDEEMRMSRDPLYQLGPAFSSRLDDLSSQHDHYLYGCTRK